MIAGLAAKNAEFMLQAYDVDIACVQEVRGAGVLCLALIVDL